MKAAAIIFFEIAAVALFIAALLALTPKKPAAVFFALPVFWIGFLSILMGIRCWERLGTIQFLSSKRALIDIAILLALVLGVSTSLMVFLLL
jgi:hypothetical protein